MSNQKYICADQSFQIEGQSEESVSVNYSVIPCCDRIRLIEMVCLEKQRIVPSAKQLNIRESTAKHILRCFRKKGKVLQKNCAPDQIEQFKSQIEALKVRINEANACKSKKQANKNKMEDKTEISTPVKQQKTLSGRTQILQKQAPDSGFQSLPKISQKKEEIILDAQLLYYFYYIPYQI